VRDDALLWQAVGVPVEESAPPDPLLLAVDGNSLLHRSYHAMGDGDRSVPGGVHSGLVDDDGRPIWALRGLISFIARAVARLTPQAVVVGFDCPESSARGTDYPSYKSQRPPKAESLVRQLADAPGLLRASGLTVVVPAGYEADDVLASCATLARTAGWRTTVMTSDRDAFALIDETTSVLRVLNGGIDGSPVLTPATLPAVCGVRAPQYQDLAALRGDSSDNLPGIPGIGAKTAARLLEVFERVSDVFEAIDRGRTGEVVAAVGEAAARRLAADEARAVVGRNQRLMSMRTDLDVPPLEAMRIPLDKSVLQAALFARQIYLGPSLWALTGGTPPAGDRYGTGLYAVEAPGPRGDPARRPWGRIGAGTAAATARPSARRHRRDEPIPGQLSLF
jgi:DNA polymerase-1